MFSIKILSKDTGLNNIAITKKKKKFPDINLKTNALILQNIRRGTLYLCVWPTAQIIRLSIVRNIVKGFLVNKPNAQVSPKLALCGTRFCCMEVTLSIAYFFRD